MAKFQVLAEQLWHSGENRMYRQGDVVDLPEGTKGKSIEALPAEPPHVGGTGVPPAPAKKAPAKKADDAGALV